MQSCTLLSEPMRARQCKDEGMPMHYWIVESYQRYEERYVNAFGQFRYQSHIFFFAFYRLSADLDRDQDSLQ